MGSELDHTFRAMGSEIRLLLGPALLPSAPPAPRALEREQAFVLQFARRLSRFEPESELNALNADPRERVPASALLRAAVRAALWAAQRSDGLVDPTLLRELQRCGYGGSLDQAKPASLARALAQAPARRRARANPRSRWREIAVDDEAGVIVRPVGVMLDSGGTGKGLCADAVAHRLGAYTRFVVDCGGDIAVGGLGAQLAPYRIEVEHPLSGALIGSLPVGRGAVASSGLGVRVWREHGGAFAHHLLDPSTGRPAWTGLIGATARGESALEAETLSKMALLLGAAGAREVLAEHGGLIVYDSGDVEPVALDGWRAGA